MPERRTVPERAPERSASRADRRARRRRGWRAAALAVAAAGGTVGGWRALDGRARDEAARIHSAAADLLACIEAGASCDARCLGVRIRRRALLHTAADTPLGGCGDRAGDLGRAVDQARALDWLAERHLRAVEDALGDLKPRLSASAGELAADSGRSERIAERAVAAFGHACEAARRLGAPRLPERPCWPQGSAREPPPRAPRSLPRLGPVRAWSATARGRTVVVAVDAGDGARLALSRDAGTSWQTLELAGSSGLPHPLFAGETLVAVLSGDLDARPWHAEPWVLEGDRLRRLADLPSPPADAALPPSGARAAWLASQAHARGGAGPLLVVPLVRTPAEDALFYARPGARTGAIRTIGEGRLLALWTEAEPWLLASTAAPTRGVAKQTHRAAKETTALRLRALRVPQPEQPLGAPIEAPLPYAAALDPLPGGERLCGLEGERFFPLLGRSGEDLRLVAVTARSIETFRVTPATRGNPSFVCGGCPPTLLELGDGELVLQLPVRRSLAAAPQRTPLLLARDAAAKVACACTESGRAVAWSAGGAVAVQGSDASGLDLGPARVIDEPGAVAAPARIAVVAAGSRLLVLWDGAGALHVLASDDGGRSWQ